MISCSTPLQDLPVYLCIDPCGSNTIELRTGIISSFENKYKGRLASSPTCKCDAEEQTADDVILECLVPKAPNEYYGLEKLDEDSKILLPTASTEI